MSKANSDDAGRHDPEDDPPNGGDDFENEQAIGNGRPDYRAAYSEDSFRKKVTGFAAKAGKKVIYLALVLNSCLWDRNVPKWVKASILGALGYFILPADAIPDAIPFGGFADDLVVLAAAVTYLGTNIRSEHKQNAEAKLRTLFR